MRRFLGCLVLLAAPAATAQTTQPAPEPPAYDLTTTEQLTGDWGGVRTQMEDLGIKFTLSYQSQYQQNFRGGLDTHNGQRLSGTYDAILRFDFEKMNLIDDAGFYFKFKGSWGDGISDDKIGALSRMRVNSDIGGDHAIFVKNWWFWHKPFDGRIEYRLGNLKTNKDLFDVSLYANHEDKDFLSRGSIRNATFPHQTGIGVFVKLMPTDWAYFQAAGIDAQARARRTGFDTAFHDESHFLGFWEGGFTPEWDTPKGPMPGRYRFGFWYDPRNRTVFEDTLGGRLRPDHRGDGMGFYVSFDQMAWKENDDPDDDQGLGLFGRYGHADRDIHRISNYWQAGLSYKGILPGRDTDVLGFSVAQAIQSTQYRNEVRTRADRETVYEMYYKYYVTPWCILSPDVQVITNPGGDKDNRDALVAGVRIRIVF